METDGQQGGDRRQASGCEKLHQSPRRRRRLTTLRNSKLCYAKGRMRNEPRDVLSMWHNWSEDQRRRRSWTCKLKEWATDAAATAAVLTQLWQNLFRPEWPLVCETQLPTFASSQTLLIRHRSGKIVRHVLSTLGTCWVQDSNITGLLLLTILQVWMCQHINPISSPTWSRTFRGRFTTSYNNVKYHLWLYV